MSPLTSWSRCSDRSSSTLWRLIVIAPSGLPEVIELRAPSEQIARDRLAQWRPDWTLQEISRRPTIS